MIYNCFFSFLSLFIYSLGFQNYHANWDTVYHEFTYFRLRLFFTPAYLIGTWFNGFSDGFSDLLLIGELGFNRTFARVPEVAIFCLKVSWRENLTVFWPGCFLWFWSTVYASVGVVEGEV